MYYSYRKQLDGTYAIVESHTLQNWSPIMLGVRGCNVARVVARLEREDLERERAKEKAARKERLYEAFRTSYIAAMLWSSTFEENDQTINFDDRFNGSEGEFDEETWKQINADCRAFLAIEVVQEAIYSTIFGGNILKAYERAGHDFWLTRVGHGAGFWDGDWKSEDGTLDFGDELTEESQKFGELNLIVGDNGLLYFL